MPRKKPLGAVLTQLGDEAIARHKKRSATPEIAVTGNREGWNFESPYRPDADGKNRWAALLLDAFATRSHRTFAAFLGQLANLCPDTFDHEEKCWKPDEDSLTQAIQIVRSVKPRNEAEAALAAQAVALHFAAMGLGKNIARMSYPDNRTVSSLARASRAYAGALDTLRRLRGKGTKKVKQTIIVRQEKHVHQHQNVHFEAGGGVDFGGRPDEATGAGQSAERPALPGPTQADAGRVVPLPCRERQDSVPRPRRREGSGRA